MYLKSLQIRGFKSFADRTQLDFEPGITVIVGPNGSGKSNIVDALTWSMGTRSAKDLRGGQMADVIFAGAKSRKAMGRASVQITIDNTDQSLPIEFSEVTVGRAMFASGENAYSINDVDCRQLDVAELLSDTGLGRETHTIVGQGRIDAVLNARPEERRAFVEEAAGILKHRRRKERALRKLKQMDGHLERLVDVLGEMKRQLRPLERQAEAAQKHRELSGQLSAVRVDRALRDLARLLERWNTELEDPEVAGARLAELESTLAELRGNERGISRELSDLSPAVRQATETQFGLANLAERASGVVERIIERRNGLTEAAEEPIAGRPPEDLRAEADRDAEELAEVRDRVTATASALEQARGGTQAAEQARRAHEQAAAAEARRLAESRERQIRWEGEIATLQSSLGQANAELGRLDSQLEAQDGRAAELESDATAVNDQIQRLDSLQPELSAAHCSRYGTDVPSCRRLRPLQQWRNANSNGNGRPSRPGPTRCSRLPSNQVRVRRRYVLRPRTVAWRGSSAPSPHSSRCRTATPAPCRQHSDRWPTPSWSRGVPRRRTCLASSPTPELAGRCCWLPGHHTFAPNNRRLPRSADGHSVN